ncbi:uncharacterized protein LOC115016645 [Cottoperca gobio]|uniref:Uncharacterized protein LOC115016645 n=1 Tax=Cottoperca gobio TaxID=56716 RepID=A0A6J2QPR5_COTGO|nr:RNA-binding protein 43 [Cottoperca gobio]
MSAADSREGSKTLVVSGVPDVPDVLSVSRMRDKLTIHFQSCRRSHGGDVAVVEYPTKMDGVAFVTFDKAEDAERAVRKEQQIMMDSEFPEDYLLTVFPFTRDVFLYVPSALVNLSVFGRDQSSLIQSLQSAHRSLRFRPALHQMTATIEGPFTAVQALRQDLIRMADQLKSPASAQTAAVKLRETPPNPRLISPHENVGSVSRGGAKAKLRPASSSLSPPPQTTGEASEVQSLLSNAKTHSLRRKVSRKAVGTHGDEEEDQRDRSRLDMPTEYRTERAEANPRQALNAGVRSSLSGLDLLLGEEISAKQPGVDDISQTHSRLDRISATKIGGENRTGYSGADYLKESGQSSSAKILQSGLKHVPTSDIEDTADPSAICPEDQEDTCIWVETDIFRYIEKFDKKELDRRLRGLDVTVKREGSDLTQILLTEKQTSKTTPMIQQALKNLKSLVEFWHSMLVVHQIDYNEEDKQKLIQICDDENIGYSNILYVLEDSCVKVISYSTSSHMFCKSVKDSLAKLKDARRM